MINMPSQDLQAILHRRGGGCQHVKHYHRRTLGSNPTMNSPTNNTVEHAKKKKKQNRRSGQQLAAASFSCKLIIRGILSAIVILTLAYFPLKMFIKRTPREQLDLIFGSSKLHSYQSHSTEEEEEVIVVEEEQPSAFFLRSYKRDEHKSTTASTANTSSSSSSCQSLPSIYWINLNESNERRTTMSNSMETLGIVNQHRISAYNTQQTTSMIHSKQLMFHPQITFYGGNGQPSYLKHPKNIYTWNEGACLMSHFKAIQQAYEDGQEVAFIVEDDAALSNFFCEEYEQYVAQAPQGWKILQFATNNLFVVMHGSRVHEPFISWQRYHHSTRAYVINRLGMETLLGKVLHEKEEDGSSSSPSVVWRVDEFPSVVADEAIYALTGDAYYSTGLWIDTLDLDSMIQKHKSPGSWAHPYSVLEGVKREQVVMKSESTPDHLSDRSLLVVMNVCISDERQIDREIEVINQDVHAVCEFHHRVCEWEINVVVVEASLMTLVEEAASRLPSYVHLHTRVNSEAFNKFLFVGDMLSKLGNFDLMLFKDNDQRINGFPWRTFVEQTDNAVLSAPLRSTLRDYMLSSLEKEKSQDVQLHDANYWLLKYNFRDWHARLRETFEKIEPVEVPFLESYFVLMDAMFAKDFFEHAFSSGMIDNSSMEYLFCGAAFAWDDKRPSCSLVPLVSTHEESLNNMKRDAYIANESTDVSFQSPNTNSSPNADKLISLAKEWKEIVGKQHTVLEVEQLCLKRMNIEFIDADDDVAYEGTPAVSISDCARTFIDQYRHLANHHMQNKGNQLIRTPTNQQYDGIFVITLQGTPNADPHNEGRLDSFKEAWRKSCGTDPDIHVCPGVMDDRRGYGLTRSWFNCLQMARQMDLKVTMVFEDDARLFDKVSSLNFCDAGKRHGKVWKDLPEDTFIAFLGGHTWTYADQDEKKQERLGSSQSPQYLETTFSYGTYGFAVPRQSLDTLLNTIKDDLAHGFINEDGVRQTEFLSPEKSWYRKAREVGKRMYAIHPLAVWHEGGFSNTWKMDRESITGEEEDDEIPSSS